MEIKRTYSLVDIADRLGRARTTLADWARQYKEFLPTVGSGRSMRYMEESLEVFGLISKMKDSNEPPEYIREQLRGVVREIIVPMTDDDEGKPYLMQLAGEVEQLKHAMVMLASKIDTMTTENDGTRRAFEEMRQEAAATAKDLSGRISDVSVSIRDEVSKGQEQASLQLRQISEQLSRVEKYATKSIWRRLFGR